MITYYSCQQAVTGAVAWVQLLSTKHEMAMCAPGGNFTMHHWVRPSQMQVEAARP